MTKRGVARIAAMVVVCLLTASNLIVRVYGETGARVLITELQTGSIENGQPNASHEFIELSNVTEQPVDITNWRLEYRSASGSSWASKATLAGTLNPEGSIVISSDGYLNDIASFHMTAGILAATGGHVRLMPTDKTDPEDLIGWGTASWPEGSAASTPPAGQSLARQTTDNKYVDTNNNNQDFMLGVPNPRNDNAEVIMPTPDPTPEPGPTPEPVSTPDPVTDPTPEPIIDSTPTPEPSPTPVVSATLLQPPIINEFLPDPGSPLLDANDEWVELYNPNSEDFVLKNYKLQTGGTFSYSHIFSGETIPAKGFLTIYSRDSSLTLSNSGGAVRLLDDEGSVVAGPVSYQDVETDQSYANNGTDWEWTTTPTPDLPNIFTKPLPKILAASVATLNSTTKKTSVASSAKASTTKSATAKVTKIASAATKKATTARTVADQPAELPSTPPLHPLVLASVGGAAVLYAGYEYREDFRNKFQKYRRYFAYRRANRA